MNVPLTADEVFQIIVAYDEREASQMIAARAAAPPEEPRLTHGRHCPCSACARQDWTDPTLAHCGMHGPGCPAVYDPAPPSPAPVAGLREALIDTLTVYSTPKADAIADAFVAELRERALLASDKPGLDEERLAEVMQSEEFMDWIRLVSRNSRGQGKGARLAPGFAGDWARDLVARLSENPR